MYKLVLVRFNVQVSFGFIYRLKEKKDITMLFWNFNIHFPFFFFLNNLFNRLTESDRVGDWWLRRRNCRTVLLDSMDYCNLPWHTAVLAMPSNSVTRAAAVSWLLMFRRIKSLSAKVQSLDCPLHDL